MRHAATLSRSTRSRSLSSWNFRRSSGSRRYCRASQSRCRDADAATSTDLIEQPRKRLRGRGYTPSRPPGTSSAWQRSSGPPTSCIDARQHVRSHPKACASESMKTAGQREADYIALNARPGRRRRASTRGNTCVRIRKHVASESMVASEGMKTAGQRETDYIALRSVISGAPGDETGRTADGARCGRGRHAATS